MLTVEYDRIVDRIFRFNENVVKATPPAGSPALLLFGDEREWLAMALREEVSEFKDAEDLTGQIDALVDLCIFAIGGLARMGLTREQAQACFEAVLNANDRKAAGKKATRDVGDVKDAVKPEGWVGPEETIRRIVE